MPDISQETDHILHAVYGRDVRQSLVDGLNKVNDDNEMYSTIKQEVADAKDQIDAAVDEFNANIGGSISDTIDAINDRITAATNATTAAGAAKDALDAAIAAGKLPAWEPTTDGDGKSYLANNGQYRLITPATIDAAPKTHYHSAAEINSGILTKQRGGTGNADGTVARLTTARSIDGLPFDGSKDVSHIIVCMTGAGIAEKDLTCPGLSGNAVVIIKFMGGNTAQNCTANINGTVVPLTWLGGDFSKIGGTLLWAHAIISSTGCELLSLSRQPTRELTLKYDDETEETINILTQG